MSVLTGDLLWSNCKLFSFSSICTKFLCGISASIISLVFDNTLYLRIFSVKVGIIKGTSKILYPLLIRCHSSVLDESPTQPGTMGGVKGGSSRTLG